MKNHKKTQRYVRRCSQVVLFFGTDHSAEDRNCNRNQRGRPRDTVKTTMSLRGGAGAQDSDYNSVNTGQLLHVNKVRTCDYNGCGNKNIAGSHFHRFPVTDVTMRQLRRDTGKGEATTHLSSSLQRQWLATHPGRVLKNTAVPKPAVREIHYLIIYIIIYY